MRKHWSGSLHRITNDRECGWGKREIHSRPHLRSQLQTCSKHVPICNGSSYHLAFFVFSPFSRMKIYLFNLFSSLPARRLLASINIIGVIFLFNESNARLHNSLFIHFFYQLCNYLYNSKQNLTVGIIFDWKPFSIISRKFSTKIVSNIVVYIHLLYQTGIWYENISYK